MAGDELREVTGSGHEELCKPRSGLGFCFERDDKPLVDFEQNSNIT